MPMTKAVIPRTITGTYLSIEMGGNGYGYWYVSIVLLLSIIYNGFFCQSKPKERLHFVPSTGHGVSSRDGAFF